MFESTAKIRIFFICEASALTRTMEQANSLCNMYSGCCSCQSIESVFRVEVLLRPIDQDLRNCLTETFGLMSAVTDFGGDLSHAIRVEDIQIEAPHASPLESILISALSQTFTGIRSTIIGAYAEVQTLQHAIEEYRARLEEYREEITTLRNKVFALQIYNHEVVNRTSIQQAIQRVADYVGMESTDLFPINYVRVN